MSVFPLLGLGSILHASISDGATEAMCHINVVNATFKFSAYNIF
jgi:hypothetical protein